MSKFCNKCGQRLNDTDTQCRYCGAVLKSGSAAPNTPQQGGYGRAPQQQGYGSMPQQGGYGHAPQQQSYGSMPQQGGYGHAPQQPGYGNMPQQGGYGHAPQQQGYGNMPQQGGYGHAPQQPGYGSMPQQGGYGNMPQQPGYGNMPQPGGYGNMPQQQGYGSAPAKKNTGLIIAIVSIAAAVAIAAGIVIFVLINKDSGGSGKGGKNAGGSANSYEELMEIYCDAINQKDAALMESIFADFVKDSAEYRETMDGFNELCENDDVSYDFSYEIVDTRQLSEEEIKSAEESIKKKYGAEVTIEEACDLDTKINIEVEAEGERDGSSAQNNFTAYKIDGKWVFLDE